MVQWLAYSTVDREHWGFNPNSNTADILFQISTSPVPIADSDTRGEWRLIGRFGAFRLKGRRFESRSDRHVGTLGKSFTPSCPWRFGVLTFTQYLCCFLGAPLSSNGLEDAP